MPTRALRAIDTKLRKQGHAFKAFKQVENQTYKEANTVRFSKSNDLQN